ncbi:MAG: hypothetical protein KatS3mg113_0108 [Planctomycetaceae bacterium]|nr:MAG: hypothetical protein KatS3mg113_0108 [Planctomycetaceae bacterium]
MNHIGWYGGLLLWLCVGQSEEAIQPSHALQYEVQNQDAVVEKPWYHPPSDDAPLPAWDRQPPWIVPYSTQWQVTWNSGSENTLGMTDLDLREVVVFPRQPGWMLTPGFAAHWLDGPSQPDLPPVLYDQWVEIRWLKQINALWMLDLVVTPGWYTDWDNTSSAGFRLQGRALGLWQASPAWQLAVGFVYLDRDDISALPAAGAIWSPHADWKLEFLFPRPRLMYRWHADEQQETWLWLGGELGGGTWAIVRPPLSAPGLGPLPPGVSTTEPFRDVLTYSVLRLLVGWERKHKRGFSPRLEAGFNFNRSLEFRSGIGNTDLDVTAVLRLGGSF